MVAAGRPVEPFKWDDGEPRNPDEVVLKAALAGHGIPMPGGRLVDGVSDAIAAVDEVGGRAVLKAVVPGLVHKTEAGAVALGVTVGEAAPTYERLATLGGRVLVEEMISGGVEALVGVTPSPLGPVLTVGIGARSPSSSTTSHSGSCSGLSRTTGRTRSMP